MFFIVNKKTTKVVMRSDEAITVDEEKFNVVEHTPTTSEMEKIKDNYDMFWKGKVLILEQNDIKKYEEEKANGIDQLTQIKKDLQKPGILVEEVAQKLVEICDILNI